MRAFVPTQQCRCIYLHVCLGIHSEMRAFVPTQSCSFLHKCKNKAGCDSALYVCINKAHILIQIKQANARLWPLDKHN